MEDTVAGDRSERILGGHDVFRGGYTESVYAGTERTFQGKAQFEQRLEGVGRWGIV